MPTTTERPGTGPLTLPTDAELAEAQEAFMASVEHACRIAWVVRTIGSWEDLSDEQRAGLEFPREAFDVADTGRLFLWWNECRRLSEETLGYLEGMRDFLGFIDPGYWVDVAAASRNKKGGDS